VIGMAALSPVSAFAQGHGGRGYGGGGHFSRLEATAVGVDFPAAFVEAFTAVAVITRRRRILWRGYYGGGGYYGRGYYGGRGYYAPGFGIRYLCALTAMPLRMQSARLL